jgi:hypothetical protein
MNIVWSRRGLDALMRLDPPDAARVDQAVTKWATTAVGFVHATDGGEYVAPFVVLFFIDVEMQVMHVDGVRRV